MKERDQTIDILRGMAIFTMIAANMAAHSLLEPHPFLFRLYGSFAAPCFIFLAGLMVPYTNHHKEHPFSYYLIRGILVLIVAALIDIFCWGLVPFITYDVLYLIGLSLPMIYFFMRLPKITQLLFIIVLFVCAPVLQYMFGYSHLPVEPQVMNFADMDFSSTPILRQFFIDGWFPVFPWLGVSFLGAFAGRIRIEKGTEKANAYFLPIGIVMFIAGIIGWLVAKPVLVTREGYSELFYPPGLYYLSSFLGFILILLSLIYKCRDNRALAFFSVYGRSSLLMYILHTIFIVFVFNVYFDTYSLKNFVVLYICHAVILWLISWIIQKIKKGRQWPFVLGFIFGG